MIQNRGKKWEVNDHMGLAASSRTMMGRTALMHLFRTSQVIVALRSTKLQRKIIRMIRRMTIRWLGINREIMRWVWIKIVTKNLKSMRVIRIPLKRKVVRKRLRKKSLDITKSVTMMQSNERSMPIWDLTVKSSNLSGKEILKLIVKKSKRQKLSKSQSRKQLNSQIKL